MIRRERSSLLKNAKENRFQFSTPLVISILFPSANYTSVIAIYQDYVD